MYFTKILLAVSCDRAVWTEKIKPESIVANKNLYFNLLNTIIKGIWIELCMLPVISQFH